MNTNNNTIELIDTSFVDLATDNVQYQPTKADEVLDTIGDALKPAFEAVSTASTAVYGSTVQVVASVADTAWKNVKATPAYWSAGRNLASDAVAARIAAIVNGKK